MIDTSKLRNRVSDYLLAVDLLVSSLRDLMPVLREHIALLPQERRRLLETSLDRLEEVLTRVEQRGAER